MGARTKKESVDTTPRSMHRMKIRRIGLRHIGGAPSQPKNYRSPQLGAQVAHHARGNTTAAFNLVHCHGAPMPRPSSIEIDLDPSQWALAKFFIRCKYHGLVPVIAEVVRKKTVDIMESIKELEKIIKADVPEVIKGLKKGVRMFSEMRMKDAPMEVEICRVKF
ncbi:hypothetical protein H5410_004124 [Solanum commersonii]|uniref:Uncharacterized protein n=1 Tax=Solanum commersonii TaxID=4109 RepID=A0A9J6B7K2_SOLCO|nr:hypothetical protein H5410_004124 [Solanum commersonii]